MQNAGFAALALDWAYVPLATAPEHVEAGVAGLRALGFAGANVTIPHKSAVVPFCDEVDEAAGTADSVNTLVVRDGRIHGSSTDIVALRQAVDARGKRVLVLGRGGADKAAAAAYADAEEVTLVSRRDAEWPPQADAFHVIVNCTPLKDEVPVAVSSHHAVVDMAYRPDGGETALVLAARLGGCETIVTASTSCSGRARRRSRRGPGTGAGRGDAHRAATLMTLRPSVRTAALAACALARRRSVPGPPRAKTGPPAGKGAALSNAERSRCRSTTTHPRRARSRSGWPGCPLATKTGGSARSSSTPAALVGRGSRSCV